MCWFTHKSKLILITSNQIILNRFNLESIQFQIISNSTLEQLISKIHRQKFNLGSLDQFHLKPCINQNLTLINYTNKTKNKKGAYNDEIN